MSELLQLVDIGSGFRSSRPKCLDSVDAQVGIRCCHLSPPHLSLATELELHCWESVAVPMVFEVAGLSWMTQGGPIRSPEPSIIGGYPDCTRNVISGKLFREAWQGDGTAMVGYRDGG